MRALILCAGLGTRLLPITKTIPECMVEVAGKPVLEHLVDHLNKYGITEIIVNLHYLPEKIYQYFGTRLLYFYEPRLLGEKKTIFTLRKWLNPGYEEYIVANGDTLTNLDLRKMIFYQKALLKCSEAVAGWDGVYTGMMCCGPNYSPYKKGNTLRVNFGCYWQDIGTSEGLEKARKYYEKKSHNLS